jgi:hypothetical protein
VPLSTSYRLAVAASLTSVLDLGTASAPSRIDTSVSLADGTAAGQADVIFADTRTLAASATEDLDLAGSLLDPLGGAAVLARVKALVVVADAGNTNDVVVGGAASNGWSTMLGEDAVTLRPGAFLAVGCAAADADGYEVTGSTGDLLTVANSGAGTSVSYDIILIGASA